MSRWSKPIWHALHLLKVKKGELVCFSCYVCDGNAVPVIRVWLRMSHFLLLLGFSPGHAPQWQPTGLCCIRRLWALILPSIPEIRVTYLHINFLRELAGTCTPVVPCWWHNCLHWHRWGRISCLETRGRARTSRLAYKSFLTSFLC